MSGEIPQPNPHQLALETQVAAARQAAEQSGILYSHGTGAKTYELMEAPHMTSMPVIETRDGTFSSRVDARANTAANKGNTKTEYHAYVDDRNFSGDKELVAATTVERKDATDKVVYKHRFKDPDTARKFGALIAKQTAEGILSHEPKKAA